MSKLEFLILSILLSNGAVSKFSGMTVTDIITAENLNHHITTIHNHLKAFCKQGLVAVGAKDGKALTFYITSKGIQKLKEEREYEK